MLPSIAGGCGKGNRAHAENVQDYMSAENDENDNDDDDDDDDDGENDDDGDDLTRQ